jgi:hypothetical protein
MHDAFPYVMAVALVAVLAVLVAGVSKMGNPKASNKLMRWRVALQALALLILALFFLLGH